MRLYRVGDSGEPVRDIQGRLAALGFAFQPDALGEYGAATDAAVKAFQAGRGLACDGIIGADTWRALYEAGYSLGDRILYYRLPMFRGDDVAELQRRLNDLGFDADKVDGVLGPHTHTALVDFQSNRGLAEDGICGPLVVRELAAITRGDPIAGRERVREREWVRGLPTSIAGTRLYLDPVGYPNEVGGPAWDLALSVARGMQSMGGVPVLSRSADISPPAPTRARRANRLGVHITISLQPAIEEEPAVHYFESAHSRSEAGHLLAHEIASRLGIHTAGRATAILKHTRAPAATIATHLETTRAEDIVDGVCAFFEEARDALG